jgi:hypothetical protein
MGMIEVYCTLGVDIRHSTVAKLDCSYSLGQ